MPSDCGFCPSLSHCREIISLFVVKFSHFAVMISFLVVNFKFAPGMIASGLFENFIHNAQFQSVMAVPATSVTAAMMLSCTASALTIYSLVNLFEQ